MNLGGVRIHRSANMPNIHVYRAAGAAFMVALSFGYQIGYSSPAIPDMTKAGLLDTDTASWFGSIVNIGAFIGCPIAGYLVEKYGRKAGLLATSIPFTLGWLGIATGSTISSLFTGRFLTGLGSGMTTVVAPLYVAETSTKELRGTLGSGVQLFITIGIFLVYALGTQLGFRALAYGGLIIPVLSVILTLKVPETPRFYLLNKRKTEATNALSWLRGSTVDVEDDIRDIQESIDPDDKMSFDEFWKPELFRPLRVSAGLMLLQQLSGINVVMFYTVSIFESAGFKETGSQATVIVGAVQVVFTVAACFLMDRAGRRPLLFLACLGMGASCLTFSYYYHATAGLTDHNLSWLALTSIVLYIIAFSLGMGPIPMLIMSEIFPVRARGAASATCAFVSWMSSFVVTKQFAWMQEAMGPANVFLLFGACCLAGIVFVYKMIPETKGKSLEDIELYFLGRALRGI